MLGLSSSKKRNLCFSQFHATATKNQLEAGEEKKEEEEGRGGATIQHVPETMLITLILTLLLSVATATQFKTAYFNQTLDHFDENNTKVWKQRYLFSDEYWGKPKDART